MQQLILLRSNPKTKTIIIFLDKNIQNNIMAAYRYVSRTSQRGDLWSLEKLDSHRIEVFRKSRQLSSTTLAEKHQFDPQFLLSKTKIEDEYDDPRIDLMKELLRNLPGHIGENLVLAGGSVLDMILGRKVNDFDIFFIGSNPKGTLRRILSLWDYRIKKVTRTEHAISLTLNIEPCVTARDKMRQIERILEEKGTIEDVREVMMKPKTDGRRVEVQFILRSHEGVTDVLESFDLDCCRCAYYMGNIYVTGRCEESIRTNTIPIDLAKMSETLAQRLLKYSCKGFHIEIPDELVVVNASHLKAAIALSQTSGFNTFGLVGLLAYFISPYRLSGSDYGANIDECTESISRERIRFWYNSDKEIAGYRFTPYIDDISNAFKVSKEFVKNMGAEKYKWKIPIKAQFSKVVLEDDPNGSMHPLKCTIEEWIALPTIKHFVDRRDDCDEMINCDYPDFSSDFDEDMF